MNFFILLLFLPLGCVSCGNCSVALHEALKKGFRFTDECGDCAILTPGTSSEGKNWSGFCIGDKFFLFQDWKCREDNDLLNKTDYVVLGSNELCELVDEKHALNQECLKKFNSEICSEISGSADLGRGNLKDGADEMSFHGSPWTESTKVFRTTTSETTTLSSISTTSSTSSTSTEIATTERTFSTTVVPSTPVTSTEVTEGPSFQWTKDCEPNEYFFKGHCYFLKRFENCLSGRSPCYTFTSVEVCEGFFERKGNGLHYRWWRKPTFSEGRRKVAKENGKYRISVFTEVTHNANTHEHSRKEFQSRGDQFFRVTRSCQCRHPKALGLAVETAEENNFILKTLLHVGEGRNPISQRTAEQARNKIILTSGIRWGIDSSKPDEWMDWDLEVNRTVLNLSNPNTTEWIYHYCIGPGPFHWFLSDYNKEIEVNFLTLCERSYNPKNTQLELHKACLESYRKSQCYNPNRQTNFCCAKDDKGEIWFACPSKTHTKKLGSITCGWTCGKEGFFENDRPRCKGSLMCYGSYNGIHYITSATRYAISGCPKGFSGFSTWYCSSNGSYVGTPNYSLCCEGLVPQCKDTDPFLNIWVGCPSKITSKKVACPSGSLVKEATVEWFCDKNGKFSGSSPDLSNCDNNQVTCVQTDRFGREWWAHVDTTQEKCCPPTFQGSCFWKCEKNGKFDGPEPDCSKCKADWMGKIDEKIKNDSNHEEVMEIMETYTRSEDLRVGYGYVLNLTSDCVALFKRQTREDEIQAFDKFLKSYSKILKNIAVNPTVWSSFSVTNRGEYSKQILSTTQNAAFAALSARNSPKYNVTLAKSETDGFDFFVAYSPSVGSRFPLDNVTESDWYLDIKKINETNPTLAAMGLVMNYTLTSYMFPSGIEAEEMALNAPAITFTVAGSVDGDVVFDPNVVVSISFKHTNRTKFPATQVIKRRLHNGEQPSGVFKSTVCCYYRNSDWSPEGCSVTYTSKDRTNCTCSHLSTIGLLMSIHKYVPDKTMELLSVLSSGITIVSLVLAILVFFFLDNAKNERVLIGKNLCFCLLIGHFMLLTVLDKKFFNIPERLCTVYAILLHYVFMAAFAWMLVEGCHLYRMLVLVFDSGIEYRRIYLMIGYGAPVIVVGMTALVGFLSREEPYGQDEFCWLKPPNYVWAFVGPVIVTTSINLCILITATKLAISSRRRIQNSSPYAPKSVFGGEKGLWLKGWISLSTLLGITWFLGLAYIHYNESLAYAFILFNGLQGFFIFLFRCVLCEQYKNLFLKKMKTWFFKSQSAENKKNDTVKSETKLCAVSATKSSTETEAKDSGCDLGTEDEKVLKMLGRSSLTMSTAEVDSNINFASLILKSNSFDGDNYPELSYHNI